MGKSEFRRFKPSKVKLLLTAEEDPAAASLHRDDLQWLLTFLSGFAKLNWVPPRSPAEKEALRANDLVVHERAPIRFFEFWVRGGRDDRKPLLTLFFHVDVASGIVRIIGLHFTEAAKQERHEILETMYARAATADKLCMR